MLYVKPVGAVTVIVPVPTVHVGCATESVGTEGVTGCALITVVVAAAVVQLDVLSLTSTWYVPEAKAVEVADAWYVAPLLKLYVTPVVGAVTVIVPVAIAHVGCATETVGTAGLLKAAFIVAEAAVDVQLDVEFLTMTWYVPVVNALDVALAW
jgi:hypothetical protein